MQSLAALPKKTLCDGDRNGHEPPFAVNAASVILGSFPTSAAQCTEVRIAGRSGR